MKPLRSNLRTALFFGVLVLGCIALGLSLRRDDTSPPPKELLLVPGERSTVLRTNTWYSNVYRQFPTEPLFALPGAYRFDERGLTLGFPTVTGTPKTVFGSFVPLCSFGMESATTRVKVERTGDWDATFQVESGTKPWQVHMAQGSPVVSIADFHGPGVLRCNDTVTFTVLPEGLLLTRGEERILIQGKGEVSLNEGKTAFEKQLIASEQQYRIFLLPQISDQGVDFFRSRAWYTLRDTYTMHIERDGVLESRFVFTTEKDTMSVLTTLWPHHRSAQALEGQTALGTYRSVLGELVLIVTPAFVTQTPLSVLPATFPLVTGEAERQAIGEALRQDLEYFEKETRPTGVYFLGTWLGALTSAAQIAELYAVEDVADRFFSLLEQALLASLSDFSYREATQMLVAENSEFGNDEGNDHHFHYGYYLRAGAAVLERRPELREQLLPTLNELALDVATSDRSSARYPYLRNFSPYDGHSWADGYARFGDGNNQESTSEALNAWYSVYRFGAVTGNTELTKTGQTLFALELASTKAYWFGENNPFPEGYEHTMASLVWGGKRDYATWFSGEPMHIHGIQWLPITPASLYLGTLPNFSERQAEILRAHANPGSHEWGDLYTAKLSFFDPKRALELLPEARQKRSIRSTALLLQTVYANAEAGR